VITINRGATPAQGKEIYQHIKLLEYVKTLLGEREARIFAPDKIMKGWQIFVRHSPMTTHEHDSFIAALQELCNLLEDEKREAA
jgi:hypothetical protein